MAKSLKTLIRLSRWSVDDRQKVLRALLDREDQVKALIQGHAQALEKERSVATEDFIGVGCVFTNYFKAWETHRDYLNNLLAEVHQQVEAARDDLAKAYRAQKSAEEVQKRRDQEEALDLSRKETAELDEIGLNQYIQKRNDGN